MNNTNVSDVLIGLVDDYFNQIKCSEVKREKYRNIVLSHMQENPRNTTNSTPVNPKTSVIDSSQIKAKAQEVASWNNDYDTLIWLWAESTLKLKWGTTPTVEEISNLATSYAIIEKDIDNIQWYLAENLLKLG